MFIIYVTHTWSAELLAVQRRTPFKMPAELCLEQSTPWWSDDLGNWFDFKSFDISGGVVKTTNLAR